VVGAIAERVLVKADGRVYFVAVEDLDWVRIPPGLPGSRSAIINLSRIRELPSSR
jgi:hypothetical protein